VSRLRQLKALSSLLAGEVPRDLDWMSALALANAALVTPQIYSAALRSGTLSRMPVEVRTFLHDVWVRTRERNRRLFTQLRDATSALNSVGLEPTLLKGAAYWAALGRPPQHDRILTDLDLLVGAEDAAAAVGALEAAGFGTVNRGAELSRHTVAELGRPQDVGIIDLHTRPPGPEDLARAAMAVPGQTMSVSWDGVRAKAPSPALQVFLLVLHDQFQDGGYWRGEFVLRHLLEIAALSRQPGGVDWSVVAKLAQTRLVRNVTDAQLLAAAAICGALVPKTARRPWVRLQHARLRAQFAWPHLNPLLVQLSG
jgi:hypothetical protein